MREGHWLRLPIHLPDGATDVEAHGPIPFVTDVRYSLPDGRTERWVGRRHRRREQDRQPGRGLTWWIGLLFVIGSTCFVLGPIPAYAEAVGGTATGLTYFVGSLFFTTAAYLSYLQVVRQSGHRWFAWAPHHLGFWATAIQLAGTLFFNVTTFTSLLDVPSDVADRVVWRPDALGSVCFLIASVIAFAEAGHRWWSWRPRERDWHITALNLWGSVFFGLSAVGAYVETSGDLVDTRLANAGTFLGALCFLVASIVTMGEGSSGTDG